MKAFIALPHFIRRKMMSTGCTRNVKVLKESSEERDAAPQHVPVASRAGATLEAMTPPAPKIQLINMPDYRENYANSVQVRVNLWDFFLLFGRITQNSPESVSIHNFQGVYLSPQQAKALMNVLQQNVTQYESAFGEIRLEPHAGAGVVQ